MPTSDFHSKLVKLTEKLTNKWHSLVATFFKFPLDETLNIPIIFQQGGLMEDLDNKWILNATSSNQDCREKDGNNPVTLGLENMRGVNIE